MTPEKLDYAAILNDMRAKRAALDASISALETTLNMFGQGSEGLAAGGAIAPSGVSGTPMDLPTGAFLGKSIPDAILLYLAAMRQRKTVKDIAAGLKEGGIVSTSSKFEGVVQARLQAMKAAGKVLKFSDGWGLSEWYPAGFRPSTDKVTPQAKKAKRRKKVTPVKAMPVSDKKAKEAKATKAQEKQPQEDSEKVHTMPKAV